MNIEWQKTKEVVKTPKKYEKPRVQIARFSVDEQLMSGMPEQKSSSALGGNIFDTGENSDGWDY